MTYHVGHVCACCGQASAFGAASVIDVWPAGLPGLVARARVRTHQVEWASIGASIRAGLWWGITRALGVSAAGVMVLTCLVLAAP